MKEPKAKPWTTDRALLFSFDGESIRISGENGEMLVRSKDAHRLIMVCLAADERWEMIPADWREHLEPKRKDKHEGT